MPRSDYLALARSGLKMPIGSDLVLRERADAESILCDGPALGEVVASATRRYRTPLAIPVMDLTVEKSALLAALGVAPELADAWQFDDVPPPDAADRLARFDVLQHARTRANAGAIRAVAGGHRDLTPVGMVIGPFSLTTKLLADPITPTYVAGSGVTAAEDEEVRRLDAVLDLATRAVLRSLETQLAAGARAIVVCEPAANKVYFSPRQIEGGSDVFQRYVMRANHRVAEAIRGGGADLIFHCCGELVDPMVREFATLRPVMLSLGSSRQLWRDAGLVGDDVALYGNLPSKKFFSDDEIGVADVRRLGRELIERMAATRHPFILGTECDVLSVPGCEHAIRSKVSAMLEC
jgi:uroporphyrinogen-III decarboxylase